MFKLLLMTPWTWYFFIAGSAFVSMVSFFQINSAFADKKKFNTGFVVIGIAFAILTFVLLYYKVIVPAGAAGGYKGAL